MPLDVFIKGNQHGIRVACFHGPVQSNLASLYFRKEAEKNAATAEEGLVICAYFGRKVAKNLFKNLRLASDPFEKGFDCHLYCMNYRGMILYNFIGGVFRNGRDN